MSCVAPAPAPLQGTVLIRSAAELEGYSRSEEDRLEALIKGIADSGARVVVAGSAIGEMALHFVEKHGMMALRIPSKFDLRRFCRCGGSPEGFSGVFGFKDNTTGCLPLRSATVLCLQSTEAHARGEDCKQGSRRTGLHAETSAAV